jgi:transposase-like protein
MSTQSTEPSQQEPVPTATTAAFLSQQQHASTWQKQRSPDTRRFVLTAIKRGKSIAEAAREFKVHKRTIYYWKTRWAAERTVLPRQRTGKKP